LVLQLLWGFIFLSMLLNPNPNRVRIFDVDTRLVNLYRFAHRSLANLAEDNDLTHDYNGAVEITSKRNLIEPMSVVSNEIADEAMAGWLDLLQLADSALPIGSQSHSFGFETLIADGVVTAPLLSTILPDYLVEVGGMEATFWRGAYALGSEWDDATIPEWLALNRRMSALRLARESRSASAALGRRFLALAADVTQMPALTVALHATRKATVECHHVTAFGLASGILALPQESALLAYLHQGVVGLLAACQKLLPVGQSELVRLRWRLKDVVTAVTTSSRTTDWRSAPPCATPNLEVASMRHPGLSVRLFIS
jgi:urease accessory protein